MSLITATVLGGSGPLLGDSLVILGTIFFACSNVGEVSNMLPTCHDLHFRVPNKPHFCSITQEFCVKKKDRVEVVSMIGLYGLLVSLVQLYPLKNTFQVCKKFKIHMNNIP